MSAYVMLIMKPLTIQKITKIVNKIDSAIDISYFYSPEEECNQEKCLRVSEEIMIEKHKNGEIDGLLVCNGVQNWMLYQDTIDRLKSKVPVYFLSTLYLKKEFLIKESENVILPFKECADLDNLQYIITHLCNLNCKGCSHFCNIAREYVSKENAFVPVETIRKDMMELSRKLNFVKVISLLGGEPFIHPQFKEILQITRDFFPYSEIAILSNGLIVDKLKPDVMKVIRETQSTIRITDYEPTDDKKDVIEKFLKENNIRYWISDKVTRFGRKLALSGKIDRYNSYDQCYSRICTTATDGKISACYLPVTIQFFNQKYGYELPYKKDLIDIHDSNMSGGELAARLNGPVELCRYCIMHTGNYEWRTSAAQPPQSDWVVPKIAVFLVSHLSKTALWKKAMQIIGMKQR